jgi:hypothetical protein
MIGHNYTFTLVDKLVDFFLPNIPANKKLYHNALFFKIFFALNLFAYFAYFASSASGRMATLIYFYFIPCSTVTMVATPSCHMQLNAECAEKCNGTRNI